jgi:hypothetical protein
MNALEFVNWLRCPTYLVQVRCCVKVGRNIQAPVQLVGDSAVPAGPRAFSLSKDKIRVLLLEGISERAAALFADAGYTQIRRQAKALQNEGLTEALVGVHILGIRSRTQLTAPIFASSNRLMVVGCFSVGTNQVDLVSARGRGIPIFNAPFSNTRSVAELVIGEIIMLLRRIPTRSEGAHAGLWDKSADRSYELRGKRSVLSDTATSAASSAQWPRRWACASSSMT